MTDYDLTAIRAVRDALAAKLLALDAQCAALDRVGDYDSPAMAMAAAMGNVAQRDLFVIGRILFDLERHARLTSGGDVD